MDELVECLQLNSCIFLNRLQLLVDDIMYNTKLKVYRLITWLLEAVKLYLLLYSTVNYEIPWLPESHSV